MASRDSEAPAAFARGLQHFRLGPRGIAALLVVLFLGLTALHEPFWGDQALFTLGAREIVLGKVLYRDFWDGKQPGIFAFYLVAGSLFGFDELGVHTAELLWWLCLAAVAYRVSRNHEPGEGKAPLVPLLTAGAFYAVASGWLMGQIEELVALPLLLSACLCARAAHRETGRGGRSFGAGVAAGVVALFKLVLFLIPLTFALALTGWVWKERRLSGDAVRRALVPFVAGAAVPWSLVILYFAAHGALGALLYTSVEYPRQAVALLQGPNLPRLVGSLRWFGLTFSPLLALGIVGVGSRLARGLDALSLNLLLWLGAGFVAVLAQPWSYWRYHFLLFVVPVGLFAAEGGSVLYSGLEVACGSRRRAAVVVGIALPLFLLPLLAPAAARLRHLAQHRFAVTRKDRAAYQLATSPAYTTVQQELKLVEIASGQDLCVLGNPLYYFLTGQRPALSIQAWGPLVHEQWVRVAREVAAASPRFIVVDPEVAENMRRSGAEMMALLERDYRVVASSERSAWHVRRDGSSSAASAADPRRE